MATQPPGQVEKPIFTLRQQLVADKTMGDLARDTQRVLLLINPTIIRRYRALYREPMVIGTFSEPPLAIELIRITQVVQPEKPALCGGMVHYVYKPAQGGAVITSIDGLTVAPTPVQYDFVFRITFEAG